MSAECTEGDSRAVGEDRGEEEEGGGGAEELRSARGEDARSGVGERDRDSARFKRESLVQGVVKSFNVCTFLSSSYARRNQNESLSYATQ